jgi:hypothetical protein
MNKKEYNKQWYIKNKEHIKEYNKEYKLKHKKKLNVKQNLYRHKNKELVQERARKYYNKNKEQINIKRTIYRNKNKKRICEVSRIYRNKKRHNDIQFKISTCLRSRINKYIKRKGKFSSINGLGCTIYELKLHLEKQFVDGMSWDNHGEWHIDHIIPLNSFDLTNREQFLKACHYINLQPLWAKDNLSKGTKVTSHSPDNNQ